MGNTEAPSPQLALAACLRFDPPGVSTAAARRAIEAVGWGRLLETARALRLTSALLPALDRLELVPAMPALTLPDGRMTVTAALAEARQSHDRQRQAMALRLDELVTGLNGIGIEPILIKGARSLWVGAPPWRSLRDIDLLVPGRGAARAQRLAKTLGYTVSPDIRHGHNWHHQPNLFRADLPGWLEFHARGGVPRAEQFLRTRELAAAARRSDDPGRGGVRLLPPHLHLLHAMIHHHIGHRGDKAGTLGLKGLYEFANDIRELDAAERLALHERVARHPRLVAMLDLWLTAAADLFGLTIVPPLTIAADAGPWWQRIRARLGNDDQASIGTAGLADEIAAAADPARLARVHGGRSRLGRALWQLRVRASLLQRPALLP